MAREGGDELKTVLYLDVFFLVNLSMDFLALFITAKVSAAPCKLYRLLLGASLGGAYASLALFLPQGAEVVLTLLCPFLLAAVVFGTASFADSFKKGLLFMAISFVMGGVMTAVYYLVGRLLTARGVYVYGEVETLYSDLPLWAIGLCAAIAALIASAFTAYSRRRAGVGSAEVTLTASGRVVTFHALCDSGHFLEEPIGHLPVIVVNRRIMQKLLSPSLQEAFLGNTASLSSLAPKEAAKVRLIPITTVGYSGVLRGYLPDEATVNGISVRVCVACDSSARDFEGFDAILPPTLLP